MNSPIQFGRININGPLTYSSHLKPENVLISRSQLPEDEIYFSDFDDHYSQSGKKVTTLSPKILLKEPIILTKNIVKKGYEVQKTYPKGSRFNSLQDLAYDLSVDLDPTNGMEKMFHEVHISDPIRNGNNQLILRQLKNYGVACRFDDRFWRKLTDHPVTPYPWLDYSIRQWLKLKSNLENVADSITAYLPNALKSN